MIFFAQNNLFAYGYDSEGTFWQQEKNKAWRLMFEKNVIKKEKLPQEKMTIIGCKNLFSWGKDENNTFWKKFMDSPWREMKEVKVQKTPKAKLIACQGMKYWLQDKDRKVIERETPIALNKLWQKRSDPYFNVMIYKEHNTVL